MHQNIPKKQLQAIKEMVSHFLLNQEPFELTLKAILEYTQTSKKLKDIVVPQPPVVYSAVLPLSPLAIRTQVQPTTADRHHKPYNSPLRQALIGSKV